MCYFMKNKCHLRQFLPNDEFPVKFEFKNSSLGRKASQYWFRFVFKLYENLSLFSTNYSSLMYEPFFMTFTDQFFSVFSSDTSVISCASSLFSFLLRLDFFDFLDILDIFSNAFEAADKVPKNKDKLK